MNAKHDKVADAGSKEAVRLTATLILQDPKGLHCRVAALLAYRLRVEAPHAEITLRTPEGREANPKRPFGTTTLGARHSGVVEVEATGADAEKALAVVRGVVEREHISRAEIVEEIPAEVGGQIGVLRRYQGNRIDNADLAEWKSPGGWLHELADDAAPWAKEARGAGEQTLD